VSKHKLFSTYSVYYKSEAYQGIAQDNSRKPLIYRAKKIFGDESAAVLWLASCLVFAIGVLDVFAA
jgi:hypothetical protein